MAARPCSRSPRLSIALALVALVASAGCGGERSGLSSTVTPVWTFEGHALLEPVAAEADGVLLVPAESPTRLIALDAPSGRQLWSIEAGGHHVFSAGGVTLTQKPSTFKREPAEVIALDTRTGAELWRSARWRSWPEPRLHGGIAIGLTTDRIYEAVDARTGERIFAFNPAPDHPPSTKPPYSDDREDTELWRATALTESGRLAHRGAGTALVVADFRAKTITEIPAPEMDERASIVAVGERVVVAGRTANRGECTIQAFDAAAGTLIWSKRIPGRRPLDVEAGPDGTVLVLDEAAGGAGRPSAGGYSERVYDAATGEERGTEPFEFPDRKALRFGGPFGKLAVLRTERNLRAHAIPGWNRVWEVDTEDPTPDDARFTAARGVLLMHTNTITTRYGGSFVSESRITAFDLGAGAFLWRFVDDDVRFVTAVGDLAIGVGSEQVVAMPLRPGPSRRWWPW